MENNKFSINKVRTEQNETNIQFYPCIHLLMLKLLLKRFGSNSDRQPDSNFIRCNSTRLRTRFNASAIVIIDTRGYVYTRTYNPTCISMHMCVHTQSGSLRTRGQIDRYYSRFPFQLFSVETATIKEQGVEKNGGGRGEKKENRGGKFLSKISIRAKKKKKEKKNAFPFNSVENIPDRFDFNPLEIEQQAVPSLGIPRKM